MLPAGGDVKETDLLAAARRCYESGDLARAIVFLFSHQLVQLDEHHLVRLAKGKTNRQYLREIRRKPSPGEQILPLVQKTMLLFEGAFFGNHPPSPDQFESCWSALDEFHRLVELGTEAPA